MMCIIIVNEKNTQIIDTDTFNRCMRQHSDGMGLAWNEDGRIKMMKSLLRGDLIYKKYKEVHEKGAATILHFRKATCGEVVVDNCHPFRYHDMVYAHNGTVSRFNSKDSDLTDSEQLSRRVFKKLPDGWWDDDDLHDMVEEYIGSSKVAMLKPDGSVIFLNEKKGHWEEGVWYSNYSYRASSSKSKSKTTYKYGNQYNYGNDAWDDWGYGMRDRRSSRVDYGDSKKKETKRRKKKDRTNLGLILNFSDVKDPGLIDAFYHNNVYVCTHCMPEDYIERAVAIVLADENEYLQCDSCLDFITAGADKKRIDPSLLADWIPCEIYHAEEGRGI